MTILMESFVRLSYISNIPYYNANNVIGYIPQPNQSGAFLWRNRWVFNDKSMGVAAPFKPVRNAILLIGDSIVLGGNQLDQSQRIGVRLAAITGRTVWPISAGSWALQNELTYLRQHPEVVAGIDRIVILSNSEDFGPPSHWASPLTHPLHRPRSMALYALDRYIVKWTKPSTSPAWIVPVRDNRRDFAALLAHGKPVTVILYPTKAELQRDAPCDFAPDWYVPPRSTGHCVSDIPGWGTAAYQDDIHPTAAGADRVAAFIAGVMRTR